MLKPSFAAVIRPERHPAASVLGAVSRPWPLAAAVLALLAIFAFAASTDQQLVWPLLVLLVIAPFAEEALFRAGLQEALLQRGRSPWLSNLLTALAFAAAHLLLRNELSALLVALPALLMGALYARRRRLRECVLLHMALNALWLGASSWSVTAPYL